MAPLQVSTALVPKPNVPTSVVTSWLTKPPDTLSVGLLDADIYGPSQPQMMGLSGRPEVEGEGTEAMLVPMERHGVKVMSMGFLVDDNTPVVWRGPMLHRALQQFLADVYWGDLDVQIGRAHD